MDESIPIYLDHQATTPVDKRVLSVMLPFLETEFGNPGSSGHSFGWRAARAVCRARAQVADLINADEDEIIFTSGATESCNIAIRGVARHLITSTDNSRNQIVTLATEHPAVLETALDLRTEGWEVMVLPVQEDGIVALEKLEEVLSESTALVSIMGVNNEIGVVQPMGEIVQLAHRVGALVHSDATQAVGRIHWDVEECPIDLMSWSAHKIYGPKGIGALYLRRSIRSRLQAIYTGGGQEWGFRPGTLPTHLIVGFGEACALVLSLWQGDQEHVKLLRDRMLHSLMRDYPQARVHGHPTRRVPANLNISFPPHPAQSVIANVQAQLAVSTGSACHSYADTPSHVLTALGLSTEEALMAIRISFGRFNSVEEIDYASKVLCQSLTNVRLQT